MKATLEIEALTGEHASKPGFTLVELFIVFEILALLASTLFASVARSKPTVAAFQCLNNNRQLCAAWRMYADDNRDRIVYSYSGYALDKPATWSLSFIDFSPGNQNNWDTNLDIVTGPLWTYTRRDASIYTCPSDQSYVIVSGIRKPRV